MHFIRVGLWRRVFALTIDWLMCLAVASAFFHSSSSYTHFVPLGVFFAEVWILTSMQGASAGQRILRAD